MTPKRGGRAVVVGASVAGLATARVLADRFEEVIVLDRDTASVEPSPRKGVPQGRHAHALLAAGADVLRDAFPGLMDDLVASGATAGDQLADGRWWQFGGYRSRVGDPLPGLLFSRPLIEGHVRARVEALPNVGVRSGTGVSGLVSEGDRVCGVTVGDVDATDELPADLVVDCTGRGSRASRWLLAMGYPEPAVSLVHIDMGYTTRLFRRGPDDLPGAMYVITIATPPEGKRLGVLFPIEGDRWMCTLCGFHGDHAPGDLDGFLEWAESLPTHDIADVIRNAEPLGDAVKHRLPSNQRRHFEKLRRHPRGFVALGDAICSFNPVYGQGMTSALLQSKALASTLDQHDVSSEAFTGAFYKRAAKVVANPWQIAAGADFMMPETTGPKPPGTDLVNHYLASVFLAAQRDPVVATTLARVMNLLSAPRSLMHPAMILRVRRTARQVAAERPTLHPDGRRLAPPVVIP